MSSSNLEGSPKGIFNPEYFIKYLILNIFCLWCGKNKNQNSLLELCTFSKLQLLHSRDWDQQSPSGPPQTPKCWQSVKAPQVLTQETLQARPRCRNCDADWTAGGNCGAIVPRSSFLLNSWATCLQLPLTPLLSYSVRWSASPEQGRPLRSPCWDRPVPSLRNH